MNQQLPEKQVFNEDGHLEVHSMFHTIQGEGPFTGQRAIFIRLAGCNLQCPMCDTEYTANRWKANPRALLALASEMGKGEDGHLVVITGGEPFRQNLKPLITVLAQAGYNVQIETNGTLYQELPWDMVTVVCSPKTGSVNKKLQPHIAAYKYVACANDIATDDGLPRQALGHSASPRLTRPPADFHGTVYLQPADEKQLFANGKNQDAVVNSVMRHGHVLQLQIHKLLGVD